jgi:glucosamine kinase
LSKHFFIGVDGGATKCIVRVEDESGQLVGMATGGAANIRLSVNGTWNAITDALTIVLNKAGLSLNQSSVHFHAGMGLAGCEIPAAYEAFVAASPGFATLLVVSDAHTACLGAHQGEDGAIIIAGTGVVGFQIENGCTSSVGGFGFPHDDEGGGAWLGLQAVSLALKTLDGRLPPSMFSEAILTRFHHNPTQLVIWANAANSTMFAELAPLVIQQAEQGVSEAVTLMQKAAASLEMVAEALARAQTQSETPLPCALIGGVAPFLVPYLKAPLRERLRACRLSPAEGAILLVRQALAGEKKHGK